MKFYVMHNYPTTDITEMLKEKFSKLKLYMKPQPLQYHDTTTVGQFVKLHPKVDIPRLYKFFLGRVKQRVDDLDFALVVKIIFNGKKANSSFQAWSFVKYAEQRPKVVYIEVHSY